MRGMPSHYRPRDEDEYEREDYDEYEEDDSGGEQEVEEEIEEPPSQEQQEFLKLREQLKEKYRKQLKNEASSAFGRSQLQDKKKTTANDSFGSFFGPSQPVIASRVLDERRSIRETKHIISRTPNTSSGNAKDTAYRSSDKTTVVHKQQPRVVNEVKKKAQTLKDMRDYSFLLSDDADFPDAKEEERPARNVSASNSDGRSSQAPSKPKPQMARQQMARPQIARPQMARPQMARPQMAKPPRPVPNGHGAKNPGAKNLQSQTRVSSGNGAALQRPKPPTSLPGRLDTARNGSGQPIGQKPLPSRVHAQTMGANKPPVKVLKDPYSKNKPSAAASYSSAPKSHYSDQKRPTQSLNNARPAPNKMLPSSKFQPPKKIQPRDSHEDRLKKKPMRRPFDDDDDDVDADDDPERALGMIRNLFRYDPRKYADEDDDSDMEAGFDEIMKEERRSTLIAREEDEEQLRLIEEEERRERMRKKQKLKRQRLQ